MSWQGLYFLFSVGERCGQILSCGQIGVAAVGANQNWRWAAEWEAW